MAGHRKCIISAPPTLQNAKYKCNSRCEKKVSISGAVYTPLPSGFLLLRTPYHLQRWSFSRGARRLMYHSQRRRLLQLLSKESNLKLSEHPKTLSTLIRRSSRDEWKNRTRAFVTCQWHKRLENIYFASESNGLFNLADCICVWMRLFKFTADICISDWEAVPGG